MDLHLHESGEFREQSAAYRQRFIDQNFEIKSVFGERLADADADVLQCVSVSDQSEYSYLYAC